MKLVELLLIVFFFTILGLVYQLEWEEAGPQADPGQETFFVVVWGNPSDFRDSLPFLNAFLDHNSCATVYYLGRLWGTTSRVREWHGTLHQLMERLKTMKNEVLLLKAGTHWKAPNSTGLDFLLSRHEESGVDVLSGWLREPGGLLHRNCKKLKKKGTRVFLRDYRWGYQRPLNRVAVCQALSHPNMLIRDLSLWDKCKCQPFKGPWAHFFLCSLDCGLTVGVSPEFHFTGPGGASTLGFELTLSKESGFTNSRFEVWEEQVRRDTKKLVPACCLEQNNTERLRNLLFAYQDAALASGVRPGSVAGINLNMVKFGDVAPWDYDVDYSLTVESENTDETLASLNGGKFWKECQHRHIHFSRKCVTSRKKHWCSATSPYGSSEIGISIMHPHPRNDFYRTPLLPNSFVETSKGRVFTVNNPGRLAFVDFGPWFLKNKCKTCPRSKYVSSKPTETRPPDITVDVCNVP